MSARTTPRASQRPSSRKRPFAVRRSGIHGRGVFATERIPKGTRVIEYTGEVISVREADRRYEDDGSRDYHTFLFDIDGKRMIDAGVGGNAARWINHSCNPNCQAVGEGDRIFIETIRVVRPGEELAYDYGFVFEERHTPELKARYACRCGARNCRGTMLARKR